MARWIAAALLCAGLLTPTGPALAGEGKLMQMLEQDCPADKGEFEKACCELAADTLLGGLRPMRQVCLDKCQSRFSGGFRNQLNCQKLCRFYFGD